MRVRASSMTISVWIHTSPSGCHSGSCGHPTSAFISGSSASMRDMAIGIPVTAKLAQVYTLAAALAGAAGALLTQTTGFASLDLFEFHRSADVLLILVIGGVGWLYGGILGAIGFKLLQDVISSITPQYWTFWVGLFLVVLVLVGRDRLFRPWTWLGAGRKPGAASSAGGH